jgi:hypothetical protein
VSDALITDYLRPLGFLLPGRELAAIWVGGGLPSAAFERLGLRVDGEVRKLIKEPKDLVGHVHLTSAPMALRYVRLFTSPATSHMMQPSSYEVAPVSILSEDPAFLFGREQALGLSGLMPPPGVVPVVYRDCTDYGERPYGLLPDDEWREHGLRHPEVVAAEDGFLIQRILFGNRDADAASAVSEHVSRNGRVSQRITGTVQMNRGIRLARPIIE